MAAMPPGLALLEPSQAVLHQEMLELLTVEQPLLWRQLGKEDQSLESAKELVWKLWKDSLALLWAVVVVEDQHSMGKTCCALWEAAGAPAWMWQGWVHWLWGFNLQGLRSCGDVGTW